MQVSITPALGLPTPVSGQSGQWLVQFSDLNPTNRWSFCTTVSYTGNLSSAEWIEEATSGPGGPQPLPNYGLVTFDQHDTVARNGGTLASPNFNTSEEVSIINQGGIAGPYSVPSIPDGDNDGFSVEWSQSGSQPGPPGPWVITTQLPPAELGDAYNQSLTVISATSPNWSVTSSASTMPPGLTLNPSGAITGSPTSLGNFTFSVQALDTATNETSQAKALTIGVYKTGEEILNSICGNITPPVATAAIGMTVDRRGVACGSALILPLGNHTVAATISGVGTQPYQMYIGGSCNSSGNVNLTEGLIATCEASAQSVFSKENTCSKVGQICCESSASGCKRCVTPPERCD